jgi:hypothetical protein
VSRVEDVAILEPNPASLHAYASRMLRVPHVRRSAFATELEVQLKRHGVPRRRLSPWMIANDALPPASAPALTSPWSPRGARARWMPGASRSLVLAAKAQLTR